MANDNTSESAGSNTSANAALRKREEALREYYYTQDLIDRFDDRSLKIKSWSVTSCGIALGFGVSEQRPILFCLAAFGALVFWYLEALWKVRQGIFLERSREIETLLLKEPVSYEGPLINDSFKRDYREPERSKRHLKALQYRSIRVPHFFIFCAGVLLFLGTMLNVNLPGVLGR
jgi:hypothetical protein